MFLDANDSTDKVYSITLVPFNNILVLHSTVVFIVQKYFNIFMNINGRMMYLHRMFGFLIFTFMRHLNFFYDFKRASIYWNFTHDLWCTVIYLTIFLILFFPRCNLLLLLRYLWSWLCESFENIFSCWYGRTKYLILCGRVLCSYFTQKNQLCQLCGPKHHVCILVVLVGNQIHRL